MARVSLLTLMRRDLKHLGVPRTLVDLAVRAINCLVYFRVVRGMSLREVRPEYLGSAGFEWRRLSPEELWELADNPINELPGDFLTQALGKGDICYGAVDQDRLITYCWISHQPTDADGLFVHFDPAYAYLYKAYTHPDYRGRRLNAFCVHRVLEQLLSEGYRGVIADIDIHNLASVHSFCRMGFQPFGWATIVRIRAWSFTRTSRGCRRYGYYFAKGVQPGDSPCSVEEKVAVEA